MAEVLRMNSPFWLVNSALLVLAICGSLFISFTRVTVPERESLLPHQAELAKKEERSVAVNISQIYENDLFGTYKKELPKLDEPKYSIPFPEPPKPQIATKFEQREPKFLDPLNVTLTGIIVINTSDKKSRAIIIDNQTKYEATYKIGDTIEDAQLIRIFRNKVIFLRSNGQQEVLYLREQDAHLDPAYSAIDEWGMVVQEIDASNYKIDIKAFTQRILNVAQLINLLSLTTAYKNGVSIGIQVGSIDQKSFATQLGLQAGDIIMAIDNVLADTTDHRLEIYKNIIRKQSGNAIHVTIMRNKQEVKLTYNLYDSGPVHTVSVEQEQRKNAKEQERIRKEAQDRLGLAPTLDEIRKRERKNMLEKGGIPQ